LIAKNVGREKLGFFDPRHENLGMILEVCVECSRPALWPADYKEIRFGHCAFHLSSLHRELLLHVSKTEVCKGIYEYRRRLGACISIRL